MSAAERRTAELEAQVTGLEKATNDDTQSEDRRTLLMKAERAETRATQMEKQVRAAPAALHPNTTHPIPTIVSERVRAFTFAVAGQRQAVRAGDFGAENEAGGEGRRACWRLRGAVDPCAGRAADKSAAFEPTWATAGLEWREACAS